MPGVLDSALGQRLGALLVVLQFGLLLLLVFVALPWIIRLDIGLAAVALVLVCLLLAGWTLAHNHLGNFNIRPSPKVGGVLVTSGPYRWIRHPMYTAVMLGAAALALLPASGAAALAWLAWLALALVLLAKSLLEERWMTAHHPQYAAYRRVSKRFLPFLF